MSAREVPRAEVRIPKVLLDTLKAAGASIDDVPRDAHIVLTGDLSGDRWWVGVDVFIRDVDRRRVANMSGDVLTERKYFPLIGDLVTLSK